MLDLTTLDDAHLGALSRALHEARFCYEGNDPVVWNSPLVVDLHVWVLKEQRRRDEAEGRSTDWDRWLAWTGRDEQGQVIERLREHPGLLDEVAADPGVLRHILRPFEVTDESIEAMVRAARSRDCVACRVQ